MASDISMPIVDEYKRLFGELKNPVTEISEVVPPSGANWEPPEIVSGRVRAKE